MFVNLRKDLNDALEQIAKKLDLNETRYRNAAEKYDAVTKWLSADDSDLVAYNPDIYPQGSFSLGTAIKPLSGDEYDLDFVCELEGFTDTPEEIKEVVGERLKESKIYYPDLLEEMNRCWRLNYAGDFHMDILPARPYKSIPWGDGAIEVPDKKLKDWSPSNPKGYVAWFTRQMADAIALMEKMSVEPVPENGKKTTLQRAIQLLKRNRDIEFENDSDDKPISIIITTLAGHAYENKLDLIETLFSLVQRMPDFIDEPEEGVYWVANPVNKEENFAEKWNEHPARRTKFLKWLEELDAELIRLAECTSVSEAKKILKNLFGEAVIEDILRDLSPPTPVIIKRNQPWSN